MRTLTNYEHIPGCGCTACWYASSGTTLSTYNVFRIANPVDAALVRKDLLIKINGKPTPIPYYVERFKSRGKR